jgi:uncharacterized membrane protein
MNKALFTTIGFLLFILGFVSIVLSMIGVQLSFLTWLDGPGRLFGFVARIGMILLGVVLVALSQTNWERERQESSS